MTNQTHVIPPLTFLAHLLILGVAVSGPALAQPRPDLSGTWSMDDKRSGSVGHEGFAGPVVWTIQQADASITLLRRHGTTVAPFVYVVREKPDSAAADTAVTSPVGEAPGHRAYWNGAQLVLETLQNVQGKTVTTKEVLTLNANREISVERVLEVEHGYSMKGAKNFSAVTDVFVRVP